ncbi:MAG TPA: lytic transglycosylase domain-containing protein [Thermoanaerobaculaceae bacterium]|mgnify:CR=1 FL=1|nr:lytic transglycosylase domain-containing protein [Thermoanaerobaculaceae bacterium]HRS15618.1 lytic transglycosylase domain-containing protein [Thermoanaerobaculaceae bacterium]
MADRRAGVALWAAFVLGMTLVWLASSPPPRQPEAADPVFGGWRDLVDHQRAHTPPDHEELVLAAAARNSLDPLLVLALIEAESGHQPGLVSPRGAVGLMQIRPEVAAWAALPHVADPAINIEIGCRFLAWLLDGFGGDVQLALAAYNAGPAAVRRWGTLPPYRETRRFISRVAEAYERLAGRPMPARHPRVVDSRRL